VVEQHVDIASFDIILKNRIGHPGFKYPLFKLSVMISNPAVKITGQAGNGVFVPDVGISQAAGAHPSQMPARLNKDHSFSQHPGCIGSDHSCGGASINTYVHLCNTFVRHAGSCIAGGERYRQGSAKKGCDKLFHDGYGG